MLASAVSTHSVLGGLDAAALAGIAAGGLVAAVLAAALTRGLAVACTTIAAGLLAPDERSLLAARVDALEATRAGVVESADARLRRLERDLHDGAQHPLAYIAMELDRARAKLVEDPDGASELLVRAHEESKRAMVDLRDLVRGIHPSVLNDRGLDAAVSGLAERCPVPVDVDARLEQRPPAAVEAAAYYVLSSGAGDVSARGISAPRVRLSSGAGDVSAQFTRPAQRLVASSGAGDITLTCPMSPTPCIRARAPDQSSIRRSVRIPGPRGRSVPRPAPATSRSRLTGKHHGGLWSGHVEAEALLEIQLHDPTVVA